jgi:DNA-binding response OmpR family regulator
MPKVLVLEEDATFSTSLLAGLRTLGCEVALVREGGAGLARAVSERFDLILLSAEMPGMNGFRICNRIKKDPAVSSVPLFLMGGSADDLDAHQALATRAESYFEKPVHVDELVARIRLLVPVFGGAPVRAAPKEEDGARARVEQELEAARHQLDAFAALQTTVVEQEARNAVLARELAAARAVALRSEAQSHELVRLRRALEQHVEAPPPSLASPAREAVEQRELLVVKGHLESERQAQRDLKRKLAAGEAAMRALEQSVRDREGQVARAEKLLAVAMSDKEQAAKRNEEHARRFERTKLLLDQARAELATAKEARAADLAAHTRARAEHEARSEAALAAAATRAREQMDALLATSRGERADAALRAEQDRERARAELEAAVAAEVAKTASITLQLEATRAEQIVLGEEAREALTREATARSQLQLRLDELSETHAGALAAHERERDAWQRELDELRASLVAAHGERLEQAVAEAKLESEERFSQRTFALEAEHRTAIDEAHAAADHARAAMLDEHARALAKTDQDARAALEAERAAAATAIQSEREARAALELRHTDELARASASAGELASALASEQEARAGERTSHARALEEALRSGDEHLATTLEAKRTEQEARHARALEERDAAWGRAEAELREALDAKHAELASAETAGRALEASLQQAVEQGRRDSAALRVARDEAVAAARAREAEVSAQARALELRAQENAALDRRCQSLEQALVAKRDARREEEAAHAAALSAARLELQSERENALRERMEAAARHAAALEEREDAHAEETLELRVRHDAAVAQLRRERDGLATTIEQQATALRDAEGALTEQGTHLEGRAHDLAQTTARAGDAEARASHLEAALAAAEAAYATERERVEAMRAAHAEALATMAAAHDEQRAAADARSIELLAEARDHHQEHAATLGDELARMRAAHESAARDLQAALAELDQARHQAAESAREPAPAHDEDMARTRVDALEALVTARDREIDRLALANEDVRAELPNLEAEIVVLRSELMSLRHQLHQEVLSSRAAMEQLDRDRSLIARAQETFEELREDAARSEPRKH